MKAKWNMVSEVGYPTVGELVIFHRDIESNPYYVEKWSEETERYADWNAIDKWMYFEE